MKITGTKGRSVSMAAFGALLLSTAIISCSKDDVNNPGSGNAATTIKVTDAPIDDASITAAYVTIADIKLDGQSVAGFNKTTVNIAALQNGNTHTLGTFNLAGKTYSSITFVLDFERDASGGAPGSYVVTTGNVKHKLSSGANTITVSRNFALQGNASNSIVADFDLRKMIVAQAGNPADKYDFATSAELQNDVRIVVENSTGTLSGTLTDNISASGKVVAYAYKKGTFNRTTETQGQGASNITFSNAVSSSLVAPNGSYQLHFLESGAYEVHFASYKDTNSDGTFELVGTLVVVGGASVDLLNLNIGANTTLTANATATAVLGL
jgi:Domain of unknown function (DUF4382)